MANFSLTPNRPNGQNSLWKFYRKAILIIVPPVDYWIGKYMVFTWYRPFWLFLIIHRTGAKLQTALWLLHSYPLRLEGYKAAGNGKDDALTEE